MAEQTKGSRSRDDAERPRDHHHDEQHHDDGHRENQHRDGHARTPARGGWDVAMEAARQLQQLTGNEVEGITGLERTDDGWRVHVDVLELRRVPSTTDVIATYDVDVDRSGDLMGYRRQHRFVRGEVGDDR